jgi:hypothetical protein
VKLNSPAHSFRCILLNDDHIFGGLLPASSLFPTCFKPVSFLPYLSPPNIELARSSETSNDFLQTKRRYSQEHRTFQSRFGFQGCGTCVLVDRYKRYERTTWHLPGAIYRQQKLLSHFPVCCWIDWLLMIKNCLI